MFCFCMIIMIFYYLTNLCHYFEYFSFNINLLFHVTVNFYFLNFQWRKFNFFDVKANIDGGKLAEAVKVRLFRPVG